MQFHRPLLVLFLLCLPAISSAQDPVIDLYRRGAIAGGDGQNEVYLEAMEAALELAPGNPILLRHVAQALARLGRNDEAMQRLREISTLGASFDFAAHDDFASLRSSEAWGAFESEHAATRPPAGEMQLSFELDEEDLIPEGIAYDRKTDTFYLSSVAKRKIVRVSPEGDCSDFLESGAHGYLSGLGLAIDQTRRRLWAVSDAPENANLFEAELVGRSAVHVFGLEDGAVEFAHDFAPDDAGAYSLNDVAILPSGDAVVTAAARGSLHLLPADGGTPRQLVPAGRLRGANGIATSPDGGTLYISQYSIGIQRVDIESGEVSSASLSDAFSTSFVDGLYLREGRLYAIQNFGGLDRVASFGFGADGLLADCRVHVARQPVFEDPTTGAFAGGRLHFIANSRVEPFLSREDKSVITGFGAASVYSIALD